MASFIDYLEYFLLDFQLYQLGQKCFLRTGDENCLVNVKYISLVIDFNNSLANKINMANEIELLFILIPLTSRKYIAILPIFCKKSRFDWKVLIANFLVEERAWNFSIAVFFFFFFFFFSCSL